MGDFTTRALQVIQALCISLFVFAFVFSCNLPFANASNGDIQTLDTVNQGQLPKSLSYLQTVTATINGVTYIYVLGGVPSSSSVYKATIDSNGDIGTFDTANQGQLPHGLYNHTAVTATIGGVAYVYVLGGQINGNSGYTDVYKATIDSNGDIGEFDTANQGQLPQGLFGHTTVTATVGGVGYIYVLGGENNAVQSTVYKATIDSNGDIGTFDTANQGQLPQALEAHTTATATVGGVAYLYILGGFNGTSDQSTVYKATIDSNGDIGTFDTANQGQLPQALEAHETVTGIVLGTNYVYVLGGAPGYQSTVYKATIDSSGDIGTFDTANQGQLPQPLKNFSAVTASINGLNYLYVLGGDDNENFQSTVYKSSIETPVPTPTPATSTPTPTPGPGSPPVCTDSKPASPTNVSATAGPASGQITLTWTAVAPPISDYSITYSDDPNNKKWGVASTGNVTTYTISNLNLNTKYYFWVNAVNGCMPGDPSSTASATTSTLSTAATLPIVGPGQTLILIGIAGIFFIIAGGLMLRVT